MHSFVNSGLLTLISPHLFLFLVRLLLRRYTLFFSVQYPSPAVCASFTTKETCTAAPSTFSSSIKQCTWTKPNMCTVTPPPSTLTYSLMITLICYLIGIPMDLAIGKVQEEIGQKDPDFKKYKLQRTRNFINECLGKFFYDTSDYKVKLPSPLEELMKPAAAERSVHWRPGSERVPETVIHIHDVTKDSLELELGCVDAYGDLLSPREELLTITTAAQLFFQRLYLRSFAVQDIMSPSRVATLKAIQLHLNMNADGTLVPLSWWQRLFYKDRQEMLEKKLADAKAEAANVVENVKGLPKSEASSRDIALIQHFMIGNVHFLYRLCVSQNMLGFECLPERVDPILWVLSWCYVDGALIFFLYWTFAWGVKTGPDLLPVWGLYFGLNMIQDIFFTQIVKIIILKVRPPTFGDLAGPFSDDTSESFAPGSPW